MDRELILCHYGVGHLDDGHSGRYEWGSGKDPYQRNKDFKTTNARLIKEGFTEIERAHFFLGETATIDDLRKLQGLTKEQMDAYEQAKIIDMKEHGYSNTYIANYLGISEGKVRDRYKKKEEYQLNRSQKAAESLKMELESGKDYLDISAGSELDLNVSEITMKKAVALLEKDGYIVYKRYVPDPTNPKNQTTVLCLCPPGTTYKEFINNPEGIKPIQNYISDGENPSIVPFKFPNSFSSDRVYVNYADENGFNPKDGVIELRRGVKDLDLGKSSYAQVRILVDDKYYMKGMALYSDDIPKGYDVVYNTSRKPGTPYFSEEPTVDPVFKNCKKGPDGLISKDMPFGTAIKAGGQDKYLIINKVNEEGDWGEWSKTIASQMLGKQPQPLIDKQLKLSIMSKQAEYDEICSLTNPTVKKKMLLEFADDCDGNAVDLKAIAFPKQTTKSILPVPSLKDNEVYAPDYQNGTEVCLVRYPHQGIFEIPRLIVNNNNREGKNVVGPNARDAIGINSKTAQQLSGADFDGDTVIVIPQSETVRVNSRKPLEGLKDFDPKAAYPYQPGIKLLSAKQKGKKMGEVTNLLMDMTLQGASDSEIAKATRHAQVIIDAEKHKLNYEASYIDNEIQRLKNKYQIQADGKVGGAASLLTRSKSPVYIDVRKQWYPSESKQKVDKNGQLIFDENGNPVMTTGIDPKTGKKVYTKEPGYLSKTGELKYNKQKVARMEQEDPYSLISKTNTAQERAYANFATKLKNLANLARKEYLNTKNQEYNSTAAKTYKKQVDSLNDKLTEALKNAPRERQAKILANIQMESIIACNPSIKDDDSKRRKLAQQALTSARSSVGANKKKIDITEKEWEAIQAGAITHTKLTKILDNSDMDTVYKMAMPKASNKVSASMEAKIKAYINNGHTISEVADYLHISTSTVKNYM